MARNNVFGTGRELKVAAVLREMGFTIGSRRHEPGGGDILAVRCGDQPGWQPGWVYAPHEGWVYALHEVWLVEVKGTTAKPWASSSFGPARRRELIETAESINAKPLLAWWPPNGALQWSTVSDWPELG